MGEIIYRCRGKSDHRDGDRRNPLAVGSCMAHERSLPFLLLVEALAQLLEDDVGEGVTLSGWSRFSA